MRKLTQEILHEVEYCAVGAVLLTTSTAKARIALSELKPGMFLDPICSRTWAALTKMAEAGTPIDAVTVRNESSVDEDSIIAMMESAVTASNARHYAGIVRDRWARRTIGERASNLARRTQDLDVPLIEIMGAAGEIASGTLMPSQRTRDISEIELKDSPRGIPTGFHEIDSRLITRGLPRGQVTVIGADSGVGKSAMAQQLAALWAEDLHVAYATFSDLNADLLAWRWVKQGTGFMSWEGRNLIENEAMRSYIDNHLNLLSLKVYDGTVEGGEVEQYIDWLESLHATWRVDVWIVDYVQMLGSKTMRDQDPEKQLMAVSKKLAVLATRIGGVGIVLSQVDAAKGQFRYSRQLLMDAGFGIIIDREADGTSAKVTVKKNRFGRYGEFSIGWNPNFAKFEEL